MPLYTCAECGAEVTVTEDGIVRSCGHDEAVVFLNLEAVVVGDGSM